MAKRIKFTGLGEHQFWCGDDKQTPALVISVGEQSKAEQGYAEMRCRNGDIVDYDRLANAQRALDDGVAVIVEDEQPKRRTAQQPVLDPPPTE